MLKSVKYLQLIISAAVAAFVFSATEIKAQPTFQHAIGMPSFEKGNALRALPDGGFIIGGETENPAAQERDMLLLRTDSNGNVLWSHTFGGPERETVNDVALTPDHGHLVLAEKYQPNKQEGENLTLVKTDKDGSLIWKKIFDEGGNETEGFSMQPTPDKGYVMTGMVKNMNVVSSAFFSMSAEEQGLYMLKVDANGNKLWSRRLNYGGDNVSTTGTSVIITRDGNYVVAGGITKQGRTDKKIEKPAQNVNMEDVRNVLLIKIKANGNLLWAKEYKANRITVGYTVTEKADGGFYVTGNTSVSNSNLDVFVMSIAADGNIVWAKTFGGTGFESVSDATLSAEGGLIVSALTHSFGNGSTDVLNFKLDKNGNLIWAKTYGGGNEEYPSKIAVTKNGIVVAGSTSSYTSESFDVLLMKTDAEGNTKGNFSKDAKLTVSAFHPVMSAVTGAKMEKVEQGILPPNMKKPDVSNIVEGKPLVRVKNLAEQK